MQEFINSIVDFLNNGITPLVRFLLVGILFIIGCLNFKNVIDGWTNAKGAKFKLGAVIFTVIFIGLAIFVATA